MKKQSIVYIAAILLFATGFMPVAAQNTKGFVIKQIYYAGSNPKTAAGISDQFIEIYNNSKKLLYADGLCISLVTGSRHLPDEKLSERGANYVKDFAVKADGSFDWTQSYGMLDSLRANEDYVYASAIYRIPGNGKQYPVKPGAGFTIAQSAMNYKKPFRKFYGKTITPTTPDSTVDLSRADFEINMLQLSNDAKDQDNHNVPDVEIVRRNISIDMILDRYGKEAVIIYRYPDDIEKIPSYTAPLKGKVKSTNSAHLQFPFYQIPIKYVIDAVEIQPGNGTHAPKRLPATLDKGYAGADVQENSSKSVIRKTLKKEKGHIILQDTDDSMADFIGVKAAPGTFEH